MLYMRALAKLLVTGSSTFNAAESAILRKRTGHVQTGYTQGVRFPAGYHRATKPPGAIGGSELSACHSLQPRNCPARNHTSLISSLLGTTVAPSSRGSATSTNRAWSLYSLRSAGSAYRVRLGTHAMVCVVFCGSFIHVGRAYFCACNTSKLFKAVLFSAPLCFRGRGRGCSHPFI